MRVEGMDNLKRKLRKLDPKQWNKTVFKEMRNDHKAVRSAMRGAAPKEDGKLKRSIRTNAWKKQRMNGDLSLFVRTGPRFRNPGRVYYAHFVELGTTGQTATHFVADTYDQYEGQLQTGIENAVLQAIKKAGF